MDGHRHVCIRSNMFIWSINLFIQPEIECIYFCTTAFLVDMGTKKSIPSRLSVSPKHTPKALIVVPLHIGLIQLDSKILTLLTNKCHCLVMGERTQILQGFIYFERFPENWVDMLTLLEILTVASFFGVVHEAVQTIRKTKQKFHYSITSIASSGSYGTKFFGISSVVGLSRIFRWPKETPRKPDKKKTRPNPWLHQVPNPETTTTVPSS